MASLRLSAQQRASASLRASRDWSLARISSDAHFIKAVQRFRTPFLDRFFQIVSMFGDEMAYTLGLPLMAWSAPSFSVSTHVIIAWALVFYSGHALKDLLQLPRPFRVDKGVACLEHHFTDEFGLPSTHAQAACCIPFVWVMLARPAPLALWLVVCFAYASLISFSRIYLGVHSFLDVVAGAVLGVAIAGLVVIAGTVLRMWLTQPLVALVLPALALATYPSAAKMRPSYRDTASILGVASGVWLADRFVSSGAVTLLAAAPHVWTTWAVRAVTGLAVLVAAHEATKRVVWRVICTLARRSDASDPLLVIPYKFVSYIGIGFNSFALVPLLLFRSLGMPIF